jgi:hypothetical protein
MRSDEEVRDEVAFLDCGVFDHAVFFEISLSMFPQQIFILNSVYLTK